MNLMAGPPEMMAVHENRESNALIDLYTKEFEKAFGIKPIFEANGFHTGIFKDIAKSTGAEAAPLIKHFFKMKDEWFQKQGYSPECLRKHLPAISIDYQRRAHLTHSGPMMITAEVACDACFGYFPLTCTIDFLYSDKPRICTNCSEQQNTERKG